MRRFAFSVVTCALLTTFQPVQAQNVAYMAANCANCHGTNGNAQGTGSWPLAGKSKSYLIEQMAGFKSGTRQATIMHQIAKGYSDEQIAAMAEYFSQQKPRQ
jgi:cytochrome subunit of sulfide dehydrogenase